jgi:hypothetical protein
MNLDQRVIQRAAALLILLALVAFVWAGPGSAYFSLLHTNSEAIDSQQALLARYRLLAQPPAHPSNPARPETDLLLTAIPDAQATALLQQRVKAMATAAHVQINGLQVLPSGRLNGAIKIGVRVQAAGDIAGLARLIYAVEAARPLLLPDNLSIQGHLAAGATDAASQLTFELDIAGFTTGSSS